MISELKLYFSGEKETGNEKLDDGLADKEDEFSGLLRDENKTRYFELLSRLNLSVEQAIYAWGDLKIYAAEIVENPYLLFELTTKRKGRTSSYYFSNRQCNVCESVGGK